MRAMGFPLYFRPENTKVYEEVATTLCNGTRAGYTTAVIVWSENDELLHRERTAGSAETAKTGRSTELHARSADRDEGG